MATSRPVHLAILGDRDAIAWVLENKIMAFPEQRYRKVFPTFDTGDRIFLYATREAFKNPVRDRGGVIASVKSVGPARTAGTPVEFGGRKFITEIPLSIDCLTPARTCVNMATLVGKMTSFPKPEAWSVYLRRSVYPLTPEDVQLIDSELALLAGDLAVNLTGYQDLARSRRGSENQGSLGETR